MLKPYPLNATVFGGRTLRRKWRLNEVIGGGPQSDRTGSLIRKEKERSISLPPLREDKVRRQPSIYKSERTLSPEINPVDPSSQTPDSRIVRK